MSKIRYLLTLLVREQGRELEYLLHIQCLWMAVYDALRIYRYQSVLTPLFACLPLDLRPIEKPLSAVKIT